MTNKQQYVQSADQLSFDGSAEPNPGGRIGAGWRLVFTDRPEETGSAEWPAARDNTNNRAEYLALIGALESQFAPGGWPSKRMTDRHIGHHFKILSVPGC